MPCRRYPMFLRGDPSAVLTAGGRGDPRIRALNDLAGSVIAASGTAPAARGDGPARTPPET